MLSFALLVALLTIAGLPAVNHAQDFQMKRSSGMQYDNSEFFHSDDSTLYISQYFRLSPETWDIKLVSGEIYEKVFLEKLQDQSLHFHTGPYGVAVPLETIGEISSRGDRDQAARWRYLRGAASLIGGFLTWKLLSSTDFFSPSSPRGPFPPMLGGTVALVGVLGQWKKSADTTSDIQCDFSGITAEQRIQNTRELVGRQLVPMRFPEGKELVTAVPLAEIDQIQFTESKRVGVAGLRHPVGHRVGAIAGSALGSGLGYWMGSSSISGCEGVDCVQLKRRLMIANGSVGALLGYLGARMKKDATVHDLSQMTLPEKVSQISETMKEANVEEFPHEEPAELVYLENGSIVRGKIGPRKPGENRTVQDLRETGQQDESIDMRSLKDDLLLELTASSIKSRKTFDLVGLVSSYVGTVVGYYALGGEDLAKIVIPLAGPLLLLEPPQQGVPHEPLPFRQLLLVGASLAQAAFLTDYVITTSREKNLRKRTQFGLYPSGNDLNVSVSVVLD